MKILILGAAGYVGAILRPAFEAQHDVRLCDRIPVPGAEDRSIVCDIEDVDRLKPALEGMDTVIYLPYGRSKFRETREVDLGFNVNVRAVYKCAQLAVEQHVRTFVYASSLSIYNHLWSDPPLTEERPADATSVYGITKWLGEQVCQIISHNQPEMTFLALRLILPRQEHEWTDQEKFDFNRKENRCAIGPNDTRRLFLAAAALKKPGFHAVQASGDLGGKIIPNTQVTALLGWEPTNQ